MSLWEEFCAAAPDREVAGYFERGPEGAGGTGVAVAFDRVDDLVTLNRGTDLPEVVRRTERHLARPTPR